MVTQFTAKTTHSRKAICFLSLMSCSINKLKSHMLFTCRNFMLLWFYDKFYDFTWKKMFAPGNGGGRTNVPPAPGGSWNWCPPFSLFSTALTISKNQTMEPVQLWNFDEFLKIIFQSLYIYCLFSHIVFFYKLKVNVFYSSAVKLFQAENFAFKKLWLMQSKALEISIKTL